jgi:hypothetical protein
VIPPRYRQSPSIAWRAIDGEAVLIEPMTGTVLVLNRVGARIWELLEAPRSAADLAGRIAAEHAAAEGSIAADVDAFLASLAARSLVEVAG